MKAPAASRAASQRRHPEIRAEPSGHQPSCIAPAARSSTTRPSLISPVTGQIVVTLEAHDRRARVRADDPVGVERPVGGERKRILHGSDERIGGRRRLPRARCRRAHRSRRRSRCRSALRSRFPPASSSATDRGEKLDARLAGRHAPGLTSSKGRDRRVGLRPGDAVDRAGVEPGARQASCTARTSASLVDRRMHGFAARREERRRMRPRLKNSAFVANAAPSGKKRHAGKHPAQPHASEEKRADVSQLPHVPSSAPSLHLCQPARA